MPLTLPSLECQRPSAEGEQAPEQRQLDLVGGAGPGLGASDVGHESLELLLDLGQCCLRPAPTSIVH